MTDKNEIRRFSSEPERRNAHYFKSVQHLDEIDVYRVCDLFEVTHPCAQHAVKKILCAGQRGEKDTGRDIQEAILSLQRWSEMRAEDLEAKP